MGVVCAHIMKYIHWKILGCKLWAIPLLSTMYVYHRILRLSKCLTELTESSTTWGLQLFVHIHYWCDRSLWSQIVINNEHQVSFSSLHVTCSDWFIYSSPLPYYIFLFACFVWNRPYIKLFKNFMLDFTRIQPYYNEQISKILCR